MKCLILAAGYATRLYPITENFPKPLLDVGGKTIVDWLIDDVEKSNEIEEYIIISNHKYFNHFDNWSKSKKYKVTVIDDNTTSNDNRLGAVIDIKYAIDSLNLNDDLLILAGDNVLDFSLVRFIEYATKKDASCVMRYYEENFDKLKKCGVALIDSDDRILSLEEKPEIPKSNWCIPPFYFYKKEDIKRINQAINEGCKTDAPGSLVGWMCEKTAVFAMEMPGKRFDVGSLESYEQIKNNYKGIEG